MEKILEKVVKLTWLCAGLLAITVLALVVSISLDARAVIGDVRNLWSQVEIADIRQTLSIVEKELDTQLLELQLEVLRGNLPLEFTEENWQAFLDFCGRTGYVASDYNWQRYRQGKLVP